MTQTVDNSIEDNAEFETKLPPALGANQADSIWIPRWIVYFQGAMLGVVAATFFVFGLMVGNLTSGNTSTAEQRMNCRISGQVICKVGGRERADENSVVFLLPVDSKPAQRSDADSLSPESFEPLDNPGIDRIMGQGGAVVRVNERGTFDVTVDGPNEYVLLVVSSSLERDALQELSKNQKAVLADYFRPAEGVIGGQAFYWSNVVADRDSIQLPVIRF